MTFCSVISDLQIHYETLQSFKCQTRAQEGLYDMYSAILFLLCSKLWLLRIQTS